LSLSGTLDSSFCAAAQPTAAEVTDLERRDARGVVPLTIVNDAGKRTANAEAACGEFSRHPIGETRAACVTASSRPLTNEQPSCAIFVLSRGVEWLGGIFPPVVVVRSA